MYRSGLYGQIGRWFTLPRRICSLMRQRAADNSYMSRFPEMRIRVARRGGSGTGPAVAGGLRYCLMLGLLYLSTLLPVVASTPDAGAKAVVAGSASDHRHHTGRPAAAATSGNRLPSPQGEVLLTIRGNIGRTNRPGLALFDRQMLTALPPTAFTTQAPWQAEPAIYEGVALSTLLDTVIAGSQSFRAIGRDDYEIEFTGVDVYRYPVMVAYRVNGREPGIRELGPLLIMFPFDDYPELLTKTHMTLSVWQLIEMQIR